jgi:hypothetical protein
MLIRISDRFMSLEIDGRVVATATERPGDWWKSPVGRDSSAGPDDHRADSHRTLGEQTDGGDPLVAALREELR